MPDKHHRRSIRLKGYDYAEPGAYFVTVCTRHRECVFGHVVNGEMHFNEAGEIAQRCWEDIPHHFPRAVLDAMVIMPNHVHGIIVITEPCTGEASFAPTDARATPQSPSKTIGAIVRASEIVIPCTGEKSFAPTADAHATPQSPSRTVGSIVRGFKIGVTKWFRANTDVYSVWQRNYYEHVVRHERELTAIREYIQANPAQWDDDENNPRNAMP